MNGDGRNGRDGRDGCEFRAIWRVVTILTSVASVASVPSVAQDWRSAQPGYDWSFPRDHYAHPAYKTEWWYFTGQLVDDADTTRRFGYQFTFFRVGLAPMAPPEGSAWATQMLVMGHAAIGDVNGGRHHFSEVLYRAVPMLGGFGSDGDSLVAWSRGPAGTDGRWRLRWTGSGYDFSMTDERQRMAFDLATRPERPLVLQGPGGVSRKGRAEQAASLYYSFTRLATTGTLTLDGRTYRVRGRSWMDKEFGSNQLEREQIGWDWFSLQLDDGRDLMLYLLRDTTGAPSWASGTLVDAAGRPRYLAAGDFTVRVDDHWTSDSSGARYPSRWTIELPSESLQIRVRPLMPAQENRSRILRLLFYWEGAVIVERNGRRAGQGYVEMVGYGRGMRPAL